MNQLGLAEWEGRDPSLSFLHNSLTVLAVVRLAPHLAGLTLRPMTESDLAEIADPLPDDCEQDPAAEIYDFGAGPLDGRSMLPTMR
jgi:hypothetical protein